MAHDHFWTDETNLGHCVLVSLGYSRFCGYSQFSEGFSAWSITSTSTGAFCDRKRSPSCSCIAVKIEGQVSIAAPSVPGLPEVALSEVHCNFRLKMPSNPV